MLEMASIFKLCKSSTENHLYQLGYVHHFDVWTPYKLSKKKIQEDHVSTWDSQLKPNEDIMFLKDIVMGDESGYCTIMWNGRDCEAKQNEPPPTKQRPVCIQR